MKLSGAFQIQRGNFTLSAQFELSPAARVGVIGPNGSGKTTLLRAIAGLEPVAGTLTFGEASWTQVPPEQRRVGMVFQGGLLLPHLSVLDNVAFGPKMRGIAKTEARERAREWLKKVDALALAERKAGDISGGETQRVALARAFAGDPQVLLLDEPMAGVDRTRRVEVMHLLEELLSSFAGQALVVSHHSGLIRSLCSQVVTIEEGKASLPAVLKEVLVSPRGSYEGGFFGLSNLGGTWVAESEIVIDRAQGHQIEVVFVESVSEGWVVHGKSGETVRLAGGENLPSVGDEIYLKKRS